ncbi:YfiR family protein [Arenibaculum pallidiluteum]|uniref:YfiR family protein n=1 Tax=Arenibaculum pallidiluteum TaxID=2812559 RepID=UPI001A965C55|nr:YfiR family protein [Arenibaculum pallidiluteum]
MHGRERATGRELSKLLAIPLVLAPCRIPFVAGSLAQSVGAALDALRGRPVLTVTNGQESSGGIVNFVVVENRRRLEAAEPCGCRANAQMAQPLRSRHRSRAAAWNGRAAAGNGFRDRQRGRPTGSPAALDA